MFTTPHNIRPPEAPSPWGKLGLWWKWLVTFSILVTAEKSYLLSLQTGGRATASEAKFLHSGQVNMGSGIQGSAPDGVLGTMQSLRIHLWAEQFAGWEREFSLSHRHVEFTVGGSGSSESGTNPTAFSHNLCLLVAQMFWLVGFHAIPVAEFFYYPWAWAYGRRESGKGWRWKLA